MREGLHLFMRLVLLRQQHLTQVTDRPGPPCVMQFRISRTTLVCFGFIFSLIFIFGCGSRFRRRDDGGDGGFRTEKVIFAGIPVDLRSYFVQLIHLVDHVLSCFETGDGVVVCENVVRVGTTGA